MYLDGRLARHGARRGAGGRTINRYGVRNEARTKHGDKHDYSLVQYVDSQTKVTIVCPEHGKFDHLSGQGCLTCGREAITDTAESFIVKALRVHGERYDYSQVEYMRNQIKVTICCRVHGPFQQACDGQSYLSHARRVCHQDQTGNATQQVVVVSGRARRRRVGSSDRL